MGNIYIEWCNQLSPKRTIKIAQITWFLRENFFANNPKKTQDSLKVYDGANNDMNDDDILDEDVDEIMNDLE